MLSKRDVLRECVKVRLATTATSPGGALARRLIEHQRVPYVESARLSPYAEGGRDFEVTTTDAAWRTIADVTDGLDLLSRPGQRLYGELPDAAPARAAIIGFADQLAKPCERVFLYHLLPTRRLLWPIVSTRIGWKERFGPANSYESWKRRVWNRLGLGPERLALDVRDIEQAFDGVALICHDNRPFMAGAMPGAADLAFAALTETVRLSAPGRKLPAIGDAPDSLKALAERLRAHPAGQLAARVDALFPPDSRAVAEAHAPEPKPMGFTRNPRLLVAGAKLARRLSPVLRVGRNVVYTRHAGVVAALAADRDFLIEPINKRRINDVNHGDFILGLDAGDQHQREYEHLYAAYRPYDMERVAQLVTSEATRLLEAAEQRGGRIDVVSSYARPVAARTATMLLGIAGPTEADQMRAIRRMFHHTFLNLGGERDVKNAAVDASKEVVAWFYAEVERRRALVNPPDDMLTRMLQAMPPGDEKPQLDLIRRNLTGMLVGAIDTTATSVANITHVLLSRPGVRRQVESDIEYPARFRAWCWEILRFFPHNPLVLREAGCPAHRGGAHVKRGKRVVALTLSAMHDPIAFPQPERLQLGRPETNYLHFGSGLHRCAGSEFNRIQVPELVRQLFLRRPVAAGRLMFDGPFPDQLVVGIRRPSPTEGRDSVLPT